MYIRVTISEDNDVDFVLLCGVDTNKYIDDNVLCSKYDRRVEDQVGMDFLLHQVTLNIINYTGASRTGRHDNEK